MNRKELRQMIREEVRTEVLRALPELIGEALNEVINTQLKTRPSPPKQERRRQESANSSIDRQKLSALLGYGDLNERKRSAPTPTTKTIAGVPVEGGLAAKERSAGMAHFRDYDIPQAMDDQEELAEEYDPQFSSMPALPGGVDGGAELPASIVQALGSRGKKVLDEANRKANWRPGKK